MDSFFQSQAGIGTSWSYESLKNFRQISPIVQDHLKQVYLTLCCALAASAAGAFLHILWNIGGFLTMLGCFISIAWLFSSPVYEERKRLGLLMAASFFEGASVGPLIELAIEFDSSWFTTLSSGVGLTWSARYVTDLYHADKTFRILITGFVGTALAFGCFSGAAIVAKRREFLYLGGLLSSGLSILLWLQFAASIFGHSTATFKVELYFGLLLFLGYVVFDTQEIIERAHLGDLDYIKHALTLFTDFVAVLVRILVIMLKNASEKSEDKKRKRRS